MSLNITVLSRRIIYQSGDFRLVDGRGRPLDYQAQKQIQLNRFGWSAVGGRRSWTCDPDVAIPVGIFSAGHVAVVGGGLGYPTRTASAAVYP